MPLLVNQIHSLDVVINHISIEEKDALVNLVHVHLSVTGRVHLAQIIKHLRRLKQVIRIYRKN